MTDILTQALMFAIVGPIIGCAVATITIVIAACLTKTDESAAIFVGFIGSVLAVIITFAGIIKGTFLFVKAVFW